MNMSRIGCLKTILLVSSEWYVNCEWEDFIKDSSCMHHSMVKSTNTSASSLSYTGLFGSNERPKIGGIL